jgi:hypothetical protein
MKADDVLKSTKLAFLIVSTPRKISEDCGMCIETEHDFEKIKEILLQNEFHIKTYEENEYV